MVEIRLSRNIDIPYLKEIWKLCFGDDDTYIDMFFNTKYREDRTFVLVNNKQVAAMLTMIPTKVVTPNNERYNSVMLYAIATHPKYQGKGFSTDIMNYTKKYLLDNKVDVITLVPAEKNLINFYSKRGYSKGLYINESKVTYETIKQLTSNLASKPAIRPAKPDEYNNRRNKQLSGKLYIEYSNDEIAYQKKLSEKSGANIYTIDIKEFMGCLAIERINNEKIIIKELLIPEYLVGEVLIKVTELLPAKEYILRLPPDMGQILGVSLRSFGMFHQLIKSDSGIFKETLGYLGLAYD